MNSNTQITDPANDDWRLQATARISVDWENPWSGQTVPKGTRITVSSVIQLTKKKQLTIPLPNATALLLNSSANAFQSAKAIRSANGIDSTIHEGVTFNTDKEAFDYVERMIEAVFLAFTGLEAFVNDAIPHDFIYARHKQSDVILEAANKSNIERHFNIDEKLTLVLPEVLKCSTPKGTRCWEAYKQLKKTRDRLVHMKSDDCKSTGADVDTVWKALFFTPAPHVTVKAMIDHFVKAMENKPGWHSRFPHAKA